MAPSKRGATGGSTTHKERNQLLDPMTYQTSCQQSLTPAHLESLASQCMSGQPSPTSHALTSRLSPQQAKQFYSNRYTSISRSLQLTIQPAPKYRLQILQILQANSHTLQLYLEQWVRPPTILILASPQHRSSDLLTIKEQVTPVTLMMSHVYMR